MRYKLEYAPVWLLVKLLWALPRPIARAIGIAIGRFVYLVHRRLRHAGMRNLELAFPQWSRSQRKRVLRGVFTTIGRQLADFCQFPRYNRENIQTLAVHDGFENYQAAKDRGKGVLFLTAHFGGWEIGSFAHSVYGHPLRIVMRRLDNPYLDRLVEKHRTLFGNTTFEKQDFARGLLSAMKNNETVGLLMDQNMTPPQGVFVDFFGISACTASGLARVAMRTGAAVIPALTIWDDNLGKYKVHFDPALNLIKTGDDEQDVIANTAAFVKATEEHIRRHPEQWLWVHRRWKTRPPGQPSLY